MTIPFSARNSKVSGAMDRAFGEEFTFVAFKYSDDVDLPPVADGARASFDAVGVWDGPSRSFSPRARLSTNSQAHAVAASMPSVCVDDALMAWMPVRGDRVTRAADGSTYEVSKALPDGMGRTTIFLTAKER